MSWRTDTPQAVQDDLDLLADEALSAAQHLLAKQGEFYPFGVRLSAHGGTELVDADPGEGEHPSSEAVLDLLYESIAAMRDGTRATAFVAPVETSEGDAVRVELEHRDGGPALALLQPYRTRRLRRKPEFGELTAAPGERRVWPSQV
jgi:hypothetical protein